MKTFAVEYRIEGIISELVEAETIEEAREIAAKRREAEDFGLELDEVHDVDMGPPLEMFDILRDGRPMKTTYVRESDVLVETTP
jgi:hypothetical protein